MVSGANFVCASLTSGNGPGANFVWKPVKTTTVQIIFFYLKLTAGTNVKVSRKSRRVSSDLSFGTYIDHHRGRNEASILTFWPPVAGVRASIVYGAPWDLAAAVLATNCSIASTRKLKQMFPDTGFDVLPAVSGRRATSHD